MVDPLPDRGARDFCRRRILHQPVNRYATVAGDPGLNVLHRHANVGAHAGFGPLAVARFQQLSGADRRIVFTQHFQLVAALA
ncbi:hypothetical protein D3C79_589660 [compost metagenome]